MERSLFQIFIEHNSVLDTSEKSVVVKIDLFPVLVELQSGRETDMITQIFINSNKCFKGKTQDDIT